MCEASPPAAERRSAKEAKGESRRRRERRSGARGVGGSRVNYRLGRAGYFVVLLFFNAPKGNERANASRHPEPAHIYSYFMAINFFAVTLAAFLLARLAPSREARPRRPSLAAAAAAFIIAPRDYAPG